MNTILTKIDHIIDSSQFQIKKPNISKKSDIEKNIHTSLQNILEHNEKKLFFNLKKQGIQSKSHFIFPSLDDPFFSEKITMKKEFASNYYPKYKGSVEEVSEQLCNKEFEIAPHQEFVTTFLSNDTPYNGLLLYHGLGTGKTCSAISVCEEMREYTQQYGIKKKIYIIASPNVQDNFRKQLFDETKLTFINGKWNITSCVGTALLKEVNPLNNKNISKENISKEIKRIIKESYKFMGYTEFSNYISNILKNVYKLDGISNIEQYNHKELKERSKMILKKEFSNRLIVIDEVHNIRIQGDAVTKNVVQNLFHIVNNTSNLKLLLLSATPMFNDHREIIWIINLLNANDKRSQIKVSDVFKTDGSFKTTTKIVNKKRIEFNTGKELLVRKTKGYISFVRGENPYSFPFRIYPSVFDIKNTTKSSTYKKPTKQLNGLEITEHMKFSDIYLSKIKQTTLQYKAYKKLVETILPELDDSETHMDILDDDIEKGLGWQIVDPLIQGLNITYPTPSLTKDTGEDISESTSKSKTSTSTSKKSNGSNSDSSKESDIQHIFDFIGKNGIESCLNYKKRNNYSYKPSIISKYGRIFKQPNLQEYSHKINTIIDIVKKSTGIVILYSQYIDSGCVPLALALEESGFRRYNQNKSLFTEYKTDTISNHIDINTGKQYKELNEEEKKSFCSGKYAMITGDVNLSPNNKQELKHITDPKNINGDQVKVVIISRAGSEGIDFKYVRQIHILDPWYNMSRIEQIIGRGVRFCSHSSFPVQKRNCEIYLHGTNTIRNIEPMDMYIYRKAEQKAIITGEVSRILKEQSIDCYLNHNISNLSVEKIGEYINIHISSGKEIHYPVGDKPYSSLCDYMESCQYTCNSNNKELYLHGDERNKEYINTTTVNNNTISKSVLTVIEKIRKLFKTQFVYKKDNLVSEINKTRVYSDIVISQALHTINNNKSIQIIDLFGRDGFITIDGEYIYVVPYDYDSNIKFNLDELRKPLNIQQPYKIVDIINERKQYTEAQKTELNKYIDSIMNQNLKKSNKSLVIYKKKNVDINITNNSWSRCFTVDILSKLTSNKYDDMKPEYMKGAMILLLCIQLFNKMFNLEFMKKKHILDYLTEMERMSKNINKQYEINTLFLKNDISWLYGCIDLFIRYKNMDKLDKIIKDKEELLHFYMQHIIDICPFEQKGSILLLCIKHNSKKVFDISQIINYSTFSKVLDNIYTYNKNTIYIGKYRHTHNAYRIINNGKTDTYLIENTQLTNTNLLLEDSKSLLQKNTPIQKKHFDTVIENNRPNIDKFSSVIGFMDYITRSNIYVFKTKYMDDVRSKGARCIQSGKLNIMLILNLIYESLSIKKYNEIDINDVIIQSLCNEQEILFRKLQQNNKHLWFFNPEISETYDISKIIKE